MEFQMPGSWSVIALQSGPPEGCIQPQILLLQQPLEVSRPNMLQQPCTQAVFAQMPSMLCHPQTKLSGYSFDGSLCNSAASMHALQSKGAVECDWDWDKAPLSPLTEKKDTRLSSSASRRLRRKRAAAREAEAGRGAVQELPESKEARTVMVAAPLDEVCKTLRWQLEKGERMQDVLATIRGHVWRLARHQEGCRLVQVVMERADCRDAGELALELRGQVLEAARCRHANYVLQKVVNQLSFGDRTRFIAEELAGSCAKVARHRYGCRIFCRLLEFYGESEIVLKLVDELLKEAEDLCYHSFGHHVAESVLEHGQEHHRMRIVSALCSDLVGYAQHRNASRLIQTALNYCGDEGQEALLKHLSIPGRLAGLASDKYASYVVRVLAKHPKMDTAVLLAELGDLPEQKPGC